MLELLILIRTLKLLGLDAFFGELESKSYKVQNRVMLSRYRGKTKCNKCDGKRLRKEANYVKINNRSITDLVELPINELKDFFETLKLRRLRIT